MSIRNMIIWISTILLIYSFRSTSALVINNVKDSPTLSPDASTSNTGENAGYSSPSPGIDLQPDIRTTINEFYDKTTKLDESVLNVYSSTDATINMHSESKINDSQINHLVTKGVTNTVLNGNASSSNSNTAPEEGNRISSDSMTTASNQYSSTTTWSPTVSGIQTGVNTVFDLNNLHYNQNPGSDISQEINSSVNTGSIIHNDPLGLNITPDMGVTALPPPVPGVRQEVDPVLDLNNIPTNQNSISVITKTPDISQDIKIPVHIASLIQNHVSSMNAPVMESQLSNNFQFQNTNDPRSVIPSITDHLDLNVPSVMNQESLNKPSTPNISANYSETEINNLTSFVQNYPSNMNVLNQESSNYTPITPSNHTSVQFNQSAINTEINNLSSFIQNFPSNLNVPKNMNVEPLHNTGLHTLPSDQTNNGVLSTNEAANTPTQLNSHSSPITLGFNYDDFHDDTFYDEYLPDILSSQVTPIDESVAASNQSSDISLSYRDDDLYAGFDTPDHLQSDENEIFDDSDDFMKNVDFQSLGLDNFDLDYHLGASKEFDYADDLGDDRTEQENEAFDYVADLRNIQEQNQQAVNIKENLWDFADDSKSNEHGLSEELIDDPEDFQKPTLNFGLNHIGSGMTSIDVGGQPHSDDEYEAEDRNEESLNHYNLFARFGHSAKYVPRNNVVDNTSKTRPHNIYGQRLATLMKVYNSNANSGVNTEGKFNDPNALMNVYNAIMSTKKGKTFKKALPKTNKTIPDSKGDRAKQIRKLQRIQRLMKIAAKRQGSGTAKTTPTEQNNFYKTNPSSNLRDIFRYPSDVPQSALKPGASNSGSTYQYFPQNPLPRTEYDEIDEAEDDFIEDMFGLAGFNENPTVHSRKSLYGRCPALPIKVNKSLVTIQTAEGCEIVITFAANGDQDANLDRDNLDVKVSYRTTTDRK